MLPNFCLCELPKEGNQFFQSFLEERKFTCDAGEHRHLCCVLGSPLKRRLLRLQVQLANSVFHVWVDIKLVDVMEFQLSYFKS